MPFWSGMDQIHWTVIYEIIIMKLEPTIKLPKPLQ